MTSELHTPLTLADLIDKELMGVEPDSQCVVLDDADWKMITAALRRYTIEFTRCVSCDGYNCDDGCAYPDTRAEPDVPELVRYKFGYDDNTGREFCAYENEYGEYVRHDQAAAVFAALDNRASVAEYKLDQQVNVWQPMMQKRAEAAEAKLAKSEKQEIFGYIIDGAKVYENPRIHQMSVRGASTPVYLAPVASDAELRAENERLRNSLEFYADPHKYPAPLTGGMGSLWSDCGQIARSTLNPSEPRT